MILGATPYKPRIALYRGYWRVANLSLSAYMGNQEIWRDALAYTMRRNQAELRFYIQGSDI